MKVGIFGDSFADPFSSLSWTLRLKEVHQYDVVNHARVCTSTFWSYRRLLASFNDIDTVIFVVSSAGRLYHPDEKFAFVSSLSTTNQILKNTILLSREERLVYEAAKNYHLFLASEEFDQFVQQQIIKEIGLLCQQHQKKLLLIPAFECSVKHQTIFQHSLFDITQKELTVNFGNTDPKQENNQTRSNHLSKENNHILANKVNEILQGKVNKVSLDDFVFEKYPDPAVYWNINKEMQ